MAAYDGQRGPRAGARAVLLETLAGGAEQDWLECAQALVLRGDSEAPMAVLAAANSEYPHSTEVRLAWAGLLLEHADNARAEALLRSVLEDDRGHAAASFLLARLLQEQGRMRSLSQVLRTLFRQPPHDPELVIRAIELLDDAERKHDAAAICEAEIAAGSTDPRLHAYAGMLLSQLGQFTLSRQRREFVIAHSTEAIEWQVPQGLADLQRYTSHSHPDFDLFDACLRQPELSTQARASLLFALAKAHDDIGEYATAAACLRDANGLVQAATRWPRKQWRRSVEARLGRKAPCPLRRPAGDWRPLFIVGMPRSGTTVLAERLGRHQDVCHRGELSWLPTLAEQLAGGNGDAVLENAARVYAAQLRQDDSEARWFIDKQPHNFMHVDLILALFPEARIIYCQRQARDNALSVWMQSFQPRSQEFAYDLADIAAVLHGSRRLMKHWISRYPDAIYSVHYEQLSADPASCLADLSAWLGLSRQDLLGNNDGASAIGTASLWQARQPIHTRSIGRWRHYAGHIPELLQLPES